MILDTLSLPLSKALLQANSQSNTWRLLLPTGISPAADPLDNSLVDGVYGFGKGPSTGEGNYAPNRIFLMPFAENAGTGLQFSMRVYGWREISHPEGGTQRVTWLPYFLAEFLCTTCNVTGPAGSSPTPRWINDSDNLCDTITLTQGNLGGSSSGAGYINSTGPGTDLVAFAFLDSTGARFLQFDFQQVDAVAMNCLWSKA